MFARRIDGVIVLTGHVPIIDGRSILDAGVPVVSICAELDRPDIPTVLINDEACAVAQTRHLLRIGTSALRLALPASRRTTTKRSAIAVHYAAAAAAGIEQADIVRLPGLYTLASGAAAARDFLPLAARPTGLVCCSDVMAIGFVKTITAAGLKCPDDVSIVGFDGIEFADYCEPTLTTIRQPRAQLGAVGARALLDLLRGGDAPAGLSITLAGELLTRASSGPAAPTTRR